MARSVKRLGELLGFGARGLLDLEAGALLHDIGMISVPESVFRTTGPLSDAQWQQLREHPLLGEAMLRECNPLAGALPIIRHHHEKWDGSGYPDGLQGDQIPYLARVFQVVDVFDALTNDRCYRKAMPPTEAIDVLHAETAAGLWDAVVVDEFTRLAGGLAAGSGATR